MKYMVFNRFIIIGMRHENILFHPAFLADSESAAPPEVLRKHRFNQCFLRTVALSHAVVEQPHV